MNAQLGGGKLRPAASPASRDRQPGRGSLNISRQRESKAFFFEKKKQKAFVSAVADSPAACIHGNKSLLVIFSKKNCLPCQASVNASEERGTAKADVARIGYPNVMLS